MPCASVDRKHPLGVENMNILNVKISLRVGILSKSFNFHLLKSLRSTGSATPCSC